MKWYRAWKERRREKAIFDALFLMAMMDLEDDKAPCAICEDDPKRCICGEIGCGPDCE